MFLVRFWLLFATSHSTSLTRLFILQSSAVARTSEKLFEGSAREQL